MQVGAVHPADQVGEEIDRITSAMVAVAESSSETTQLA
jgi:hypothetical protein